MSATNGAGEPGDELDQIGLAVGPGLFVDVAQVGLDCSRSVARVIEEQHVWVAQGTRLVAYVTEARLEAGIAGSQLIQGNIFRNARARHADRTIDAPSRFERHRRLLGARPDAETIAEVDQSSVARG